MFVVKGFFHFLIYSIFLVLVIISPSKNAQADDSVIRSIFLDLEIAQTWRAVLDFAKFDDKSGQPIEYEPTGEEFRGGYPEIKRELEKRKLRLAELLAIKSGLDS